MADFCKQCSIENFGEDFGDLANLCGIGKFGFELCEGCGCTIINRDGECVSAQCLKKHGKSPECRGHELYSPVDFTKEEAEKEGQLYVMVVEGGLAVCKKCGDYEAGLDSLCSAAVGIKLRNSSIGK